MHFDTQQLEHLITTYGPLAIFIGTFLEGETIVVVAGFLAHQGDLDVATVALCAFMGSFLGDQVWFYIGRHFTRFQLVQRVMQKPIFGKALSLIEDHPRKFILTFRFVYGIRNVSPIAIGISAVTSRMYFVYNAIAAIVWAGTFTAAGFFFGKAVQAYLGGSFPLDEKILIAVGAAIAVYIVFVLGARFWRWVTGNQTGRPENEG